MSRLTRFFATTLLVLSMSAFAAAGDMQGPGAPEPPPPGDMQGPGAPGSSATTLGGNLSSDVEAIIEGSKFLGRWVFNLP